MTETEKKIIEALSRMFRFEEPTSITANLISSVAVPIVAKWHDSEMGKLKERLIGVVKKHSGAFGTITYYDGGEIVASPNTALSELVKEMEAVDSPKPAEPISPFGCKCWKKGENCWVLQSDRETVHWTTEHDKFCRFCGKARVEKP